MSRTREEVEKELRIYAQILMDKRSEMENTRIQELWEEIYKIDRENRREP